MSRTIIERLGWRLLTMVVAAGVVATLVGGAYATVGSHETTVTDQSPAGTSVSADDQAGSTDDAPDPEPAPTTEEQHGGPVARVHEGCPDAANLAGNWTHGDYVSAHASDRDAKKVAARSACGKPQHDGPEIQRSSHKKSETSRQDKASDGTEEPGS